MSSESADAADYEELFKAATEGQVDRLRAALKPKLDVNRYVLGAQEPIARTLVSQEYGNATLAV